MNFDDALDYIKRKKISATYIRDNSEISLSTARRLLNSGVDSSTPQTDTQTRLIEFVKSYKSSYDSVSQEEYLFNLEKQIDDHFNELMKRPSFRKTIHIEVLKIIVKAQEKDNIINTDKVNDIMRESR